MNDKKKILIVDDELFVRKVVAKVLEKEGYNVAIASDGKDALMKAESLDPDLVITDLSMPNMNGMELALMLKKKEIRVIILSAHVSESAVKKLTLLNVKDIIVKPFDMDKLLNSVKKAFAAESPDSTPLELPH